MKTAIVYHSEHHGNTKKLLDAIAAQHDVVLFKADTALHANLEEYDRIGFASGIYYHKFHDSVLRFAAEKLPYGKDVFFLYTYGVKRSLYINTIKAAVEEKGARILGSFGCRGFDTFGPFQIIGGIAKGHPDSEDIAAAVGFFAEISREGGER